MSDRIERKATVRWVQLGKLAVSDLAQRELKQSRVDHLVAHFDPEDTGLLEVSERGGKYYIIDGQHRAAAMREIYGDNHHTYALVHTGLTERQEAEKFLALNNVLNVSAMDRYHKGVTAGRPIEVEIDGIIRSNGLVVARHGHETAIQAVGRLTKVYTRNGPAALDKTLRIISNAYGGAGFEAPMIDGLGLVCGRYGDELDEQITTMRLQRKAGGVKGLIGAARKLSMRTNQPLNQCVAVAIVEAVNTGKGGKKLKAYWNE